MQAPDALAIPPAESPTAAGEERSLVAVGTTRGRVPSATFKQSARLSGPLTLTLLFVAFPGFIGLLEALKSVWLALTALVGAWALLIVLIVGLSRLRRARRAEVDESGVRLFRGRKVDYVPFDRIGGSMISEFRTPGCLSWLVWRPDGTIEMIVPLAHTQDVEAARRATRAIEVRRATVPHRHAATRRRLTTDQQPPRAWIESLKRAAGTQAYRGEAWDEEALWEILRDPAFPHTERAAAAVVLRFLFDDRAVEQMRKELHDGAALTIKAWLHQADSAGGWLPPDYPHTLT